MSRLKRPGYSDGIKRALDLAVSVAFIILLAPILAAAAIAIVLSDGLPVYFHQLRAGRHGTTFRLHKLRTMKRDTDLKSGGFPQQDAVIPLGTVLRRLSIDELPQLINIAKGEMSFVGPRPALVSQMHRYTDVQLGRLEVRPGLTGLAQVRFRNNAPWSRRIQADLEYIERLSVRLDAEIIFQTIVTVLTGKGQVVGQTAADVDDLGPTRTHAKDSTS